MASKTISGTTSNEYIKSRIVWTSTQNTISNTSTVKATLQYIRTNTGFATSGTGSFTLSIGGSKTTATKTISITNSAWVTALEWEVTVAHDNDGTKSISISATGSIPGTTLTATSCGDTVDIDTIPRASSIDNATNTTLGGTCRIYWTPKSSSFQYSLKFSLGNWSYTTTNIKPKTTASYLYQYTIPLEVANQLPNAKTGTMEVRLSTLNSGGTAQIGSSTSKTFTVTVPDNASTKPKVSMSIAPVNSLADKFSSLYIQGHSKVKASSLTGEGKYGASISSYKFYVGTKSYNAPYQSDALSSSGTITVKARATDSRGYYNEVEQQIEVLPYSNPLILPASDESAIICARCDEDGNLSDSGTDLKIKARRSYSKVEVEVDGEKEQKNYCTIKYRFREESTTKFSDWYPILNGTDTDDTIDTKLSYVVSSTETSYVVQVGVMDDVGGSDALQFIIPTDFVTIDIPESHKGKRIGLFRYAQDTDEPGIDVGAPIHGGSIDSLKLGTRITATSAAPIDLNNYKTPGCYFSPNEENSKYIENTPYIGGGFGLEVRELQSATYIRQTLYYGRTTWIRHYDGTVWSEWARTLATDKDASFAADFVIEEGTSNGWTYKKWKSGTYEMFGYFTVKTTVAGTAYGGMYYSEQFKLPTPFTISSAVVAGSATSWFFPITGGLSNGESGEDSNKNVGIRLFRPTEFAVGQETSIRLHVTGEYT